MLKQASKGIASNCFLLPEVLSSHNTRQARLMSKGVDLLGDLVLDLLVTLFSVCFHLKRVNWLDATLGVNLVQIMRILLTFVIPMRLHVRLGACGER